MKILLPRRKFNVRGLPYFFLAGPVRGGGDWQAEMCVLLQERLPTDFVVAVPCRWTPTHPLHRSFIQAPEEPEWRQLTWERQYLKKASKSGCILFWLPVESTANPYPGLEPYAMDTRGELGEWRWRMKTEKARVVIGAQSGFYGLSQIQRNFTQALGYNFPIYPSMLETAAAAALTSYQEG